MVKAGSNLLPGLQESIRGSLSVGGPTIGSVARELEIPVRTLQRKLLESGHTYSELLEKTRLEEAKRGLHQSRMSIAEIGRSLGYSDASHFSRAFRRWTGVSPKEYQRKHR